MSLTDLAQIIDKDQKFYGNWEMFIHEMLDFTQDLSSGDEESQHGDYND